MGTGTMPVAFAFSRVLFDGPPSTDDLALAENLCSAMFSIEVDEAGSIFSEEQFPVFKLWTELLFWSYRPSKPFRFWPDDYPEFLFDIRPIDDSTFAVETNSTGHPVRCRQQDVMAAIRRFDEQLVVAVGALGIDIREHRPARRDGHSPSTRLVFEKEDGYEETETVWGAAMEEADRYELLNVPMFAFGVSRGDVVEARGSEPPLRVTRVVARGGHSTYRVAIAPERTLDGTLRLQMLAGDHGCGVERLSPTFVAIDVPPSANIVAVYEDLEAGMDAGTWTFDETHYGRP